MPSLNEIGAHSESDMTDFAIRVKGLSKSYGQQTVVNDIAFDVQRGEVFALLGPNGAGITSTVEILEGHRQRDKGNVEVLGYDPINREKRFREQIGIVLQGTGVEPQLKVGETIEMFRGYYPDPFPLEEVLDLVGLTSERNKLVRQLSGGQQRRLDVGVALAGNPQLLFLDEPTTGFDPSARRDAWDMISNLRLMGRTVVLTTHYMDEAEHLADHIALMSKGSILSYGTVEEIVARQAGTVLVFKLEDAKTVLPKDLSDGATIEGNRVTIRTNAPVPLLYNLTSWALDNDQYLDALRVEKPTLEDAYLDIVRSSTEMDAQ